MLIGTLDQRVTIQRPVRSADGMSGFTVTWKDVGTVWAAVWPVSAVEAKAALQTGMQITHQVRIRYRQGITADHRVYFEERYLNIVSILDPNNAHDILDLICKEAA